MAKQPKTYLYAICPEGCEHRVTKVAGFWEWGHGRAGYVRFERRPNPHYRPRVGVPGLMLRF
jgi:hypothetical protein